MTNFRIITAAAVLAVTALAPVAATAEDGAALYQSKTCFTCHGKDGDSPIMPSYPKIAGQNPEYSLQQMKDIKSGARANGMSAAMQGVMHLVNDEEMKALVPSLLTRHHAHHYLGFAANQWRLFQRKPTGKALLLQGFGPQVFAAYQMLRLVDRPEDGRQDEKYALLRRAHHPPRGAQLRDSVGRSQDALSGFGVAVGHRQPRLKGRQGLGR